MTDETTTIDVSEDAILARLKELVRKVIDEEHPQAAEIDKITAETHLLSLPMDSMATMELMGSVEEMYTVYIPEDKAFEFQTVRDLIQYIQEKLAAKAARAAARQT